MKFEERLVLTRKMRGMSQETLAELVGVSRQAVSKWETSEAQPDYTKLIALADALEVSLDYLCGRDGEPVCVPEASVPTEAPRRKKVWLRLSGVLGALILLAAGVFIGWQLTPSGRETPGLTATQLPDAVTVDGVKFTCAGGEKLHYQFIPSVAGDGYTYQISFRSAYGKEYTFDAPLQGGSCFGTANLPGGFYSVTAIVSNGVERRLILLTNDLTFLETSLDWVSPEN